MMEEQLDKMMHGQVVMMIVELIVNGLVDRWIDDRLFCQL